MAQIWKKFGYLQNKQKLSKNRSQKQRKSKALEGGDAESIQKIEDALALLEKIESDT